MRSITATFGAYVLTKAEDAKITVTKNGEICSNSKQAIREIAKEVGFEVDPAWNTQTAGAKLIKFLLSEHAAEGLSEKDHRDLNGDGTVTFGERIKFGLKQVSEKAGQVVGQAKEKGKDIYDSASVKTKEAVDAAKTKIKELKEKETTTAFLKKIGIGEKEDEENIPTEVESPVAVDDDIYGYKQYEYISADDLSFDDWWLEETDEDAAADYNCYVQSAISDCQNDEIALVKLGKWSKKAPAGLYFTNPNGGDGLLKDYQTCFWWDGEKAHLIRNYEDFEW